MLTIKNTEVEMDKHEMICYFVPSSNATTIVRILYFGGGGGGGYKHPHLGSGLLMRNNLINTYNQIMAGDGVACHKYYVSPNLVSLVQTHFMNF